jgi:hypothetical protein
MSTQALPAPAAEPVAAPIEEQRLIGLRDAMSHARAAVALFTELCVDAVASCERDGEGWRVVVDVVEAPARIGDNDMLASFEVLLDAYGECERYSRIGRYHRTDAAR